MKYAFTYKIIFMEKLGEISYSLYLAHLFILGFVALIYRKLNINTMTSELFYIASMLGLSLVFGYLVYIFIEKKLAQKIKILLIKYKKI